MKDANELWEIISTCQSESNTHFDETMQYFENSANILFETCKAKLEKAKAKYNYYKDAVEILISFGEISNDFTDFKKLHIDVSKEKGYFKKEAKKVYDSDSIIPASYLLYTDFNFAIKNAKVPISGLEKKDYDKLTYFKKILKNKGFFCCTRNGYNSISFAIVLTR